MKTIHKDWLDHFKQELQETAIIRIVSPFITYIMVEHLLENWTGSDIQIITRFNLNDFRSNVSSINALERLMNNGAKVIGIKNLHSKAYIFDSKSAIITSANFTSGGFFSNREFGIITREKQEVDASISYFEELWEIGNEQLLSKDLISEWRSELQKLGSNDVVPKLKDYGISHIEKVIGDKRYFVKFYGKRDDRLPLSDSTKEMVEGTECHFAVTFPKGKGDRRPRRYRDGDIVFIARMVEDKDYAIMGRAIARRHIDNRDVASPEDIKRVCWKAEYPIYIRIHSGEFLDTIFGNCPMLQQLMCELGGECFETTKWKYLDGNFGINPRLSLRRRPDIQLSEEGAMWLEQKFKEAKDEYPLLSDVFIDSLYQGTPVVK